MATTFNDLVELMDRLRSPGGCPWDREQTYATLAPMLLEEAYEAFGALEEACQGDRYPRPQALHALSAVHVVQRVLLPLRAQ